MRLRLVFDRGKALPFQILLDQFFEFFPGAQAIGLVQAGPFFLNIFLPDLLQPVLQFSHVQLFR